MGVAGTLGTAGVRHHAVGAYIVAAAHDGDESRYPVLVRAHGGDIGVGLFAGEQYVDLRAVRADGFQQAGQGTVGVGAHHQVYLVRVKELVLQALCHTAHDAHHQAGPIGTQPVEDLDAAPDALLGVVADAAGVGHHQVGLFHNLCAPVAGIGQYGENHLGVIDIHLTPVSFDIRSFTHRVQSYEKNHYLCVDESF